jgi:predicted protein tyrosine phosphatase
MEVHIRSHKEALAMIVAKPNTYDVIFINEPYFGVDAIFKQKSRSLTTHFFHDLERPIKGRRMPKYNDVKAMLDFVDKKSNILCCCPSGISRSAAIGYAVTCMKFYNPEAALKILDYDKHIPNVLISQYASEILQKPDILGRINRFREGVFSTL